MVTRCPGVSSLLTALAVIALSRPVWSIFHLAILLLVVPAGRVFRGIDVLVLVDFLVTGQVMLAVVAHRYLSKLP